MEAFDGNTTMVAERVVFGAFQGSGLQSARLRVGGFAHAALYDVTFEEVNGVYDIDGRNGSVYTAQGGSLDLRNGLQWPVKGVNQIPTNLTFLSGSDPDLREIRQVRAL